MSKKRNKVSAFHNNLENMTYNQIMNMTILDSNFKIRFLHDIHDTKFYVAFDGRTNMTYFSKSYQQAETRFNYLVEDCKNQSITSNI